MALGLFVYDLIFFSLAAVLYGGAGIAAARVFSFLVDRGLPVAFAVFPAFLAGVFALIAQVSLLTSLCPRLKPGRYPMMKGAVFFGWVLRSALRRVLFVPVIKSFVFASNVLRFLALRGLGARVAFSTNMSSDVELLDPSLFVAGSGATLGSRCLVSGHFVEKGELVLGAIEIGEGSLLSGEVVCGPNVVIGARAVVKAQASVSVGVRIGDRAKIGACAFLDTNAVIEEGASVPNNAHIPARGVVRKGES